MQLIKTVAEARGASQKFRQEGRLGFVATMGALHEGHMSLVRASVSECDRTVVSIFVNPRQFAPTEDLDTYPRTLDRDRMLLEAEGIDAVFAPTLDEMYPDGFATSIEQVGTTEYLCGRSRPHFFGGVLTIVLKLFHVVVPHVVYFGRKDVQQAIVIGRMIRDLSLDIRLRVLPIVREPDGLAMSSRNRALSGKEREAARTLSISLLRARELFDGGERDAATLVEEARKVFVGRSDVRVDYVELVGLQSVHPIERVESGALLAVAAFVGSTRLIDNAILGDSDGIGDGIDPRIC